jgi:hypothetical protein
MKKSLQIIILLITPYFIFPNNLLDSLNNKNYKFDVTKTLFNFDFLSINMKNEPNMGLVGAHYLIDLNEYIYGGIGMYGATTGERGGLFTLGANIGTKLNFYYFILDFGLHLGGGGGDAAKVGGGLFTLPHASIFFPFGDLNLGIGYSHINFNDGNINNSQLKFDINLPLHYSWYDYNSAESKYHLHEFGHIDPYYTKSNSKHCFAAKFDNYFPLKGSKDVNNKDLDVPINLVGFEYNYFINKKLFLSFEADGAYRGIKGGYMDLLGGIGYTFNSNFFDIRTKLLAGAGGGGSIETDGGMFFIPKLEIEKELFLNTIFNINTGYLFSLQNNLNAITLGGTLKYKLQIGDTKSKENNKFSLFKLKGFSIDFSSQTYLNAQKNDTRNIDLGQLSTQLNFHISKYSYLAGQATFAYIGNAGAYAEGLVGYGFTQNFTDDYRYFIQLLAGTAGGGGVATDQGFVIKPSLGTNFQFHNQYGIQCKLGYIYAPLGKLSCPFFGIGLNYQISVPILK